MKTDILGVCFDAVTMPEALSRAASFLDAPAAHIVVTPNAEMAYRCQRDAQARRALGAADLSIPDSVGIFLASRILGRPLPARVAGIDFAWALLPVLAERKAGLFLLGGKPGVAEAAGARLSSLYPGLVVGTKDGFFSDPSDPIDAIRASKARVVFVCLGAPKQELWMAEHGSFCGASLLVGLGGALDVWSGRVKRAPPMFSRLGLEWFYRLITQPSRLGRMCKLPAFLWAVVRARFTRRPGAS